MATRRSSKLIRVFREPRALFRSRASQRSRVNVLLFLLVAVAGYAFWSSYYPTVKVDHKGLRRGNYRFMAEYWTEPKLHRLWQQEDFKDLKADSQWGLFLKLCDWTHRQWKSGVPNPYPPCNAIDILREIRSGRTGGFCAQYAYVLGDVLKSVGFFNVRYIEATQPDGSGHFSLETWSDEYEKWVLLGAWRDYYYELVDTGVPANAYDVHLSLHGGPQVKAVAIDGRTIPDNREACKFFDNIAVSLRSDFMGDLKPLTENDRWDMFLFLRDEYTSPMFRETVPYRNVTTRVEDLYFDCDQTRVEFERDHRHVYFHLYNDRTAPNFKCFVIRREPGGEWEEVQEDPVLERQKGWQTIWFATKNQFGRVGVPNQVDIFW